MNPFVSVYHAVKKLFTFPKKKGQKKKEDITAKLNQETLQNASGVVTTTKKRKSRQEELGLKKLSFNYVVKNDAGQTIKSIFEAYDKSEVEAFLKNEGYTIVSITLRKKYEMEIIPTKLSVNELAFSLTQISTYIKAGIPLIDSVRILARQTTNPHKRKIYDRIVYDLVTGESFSTALENQEVVFPRLLINMVKTAEMTGDLTSILDEMSDYYTEIEKTRRAMITALIYPAIIMIVAIAVVAFILIWVVPNFVDMYRESGAELPGITIFTMNASDFLSNNYMYIVVALLVILGIYHYMYKNIKGFRKAMQTFYMKIPVFGNIIIYNEVTMFTKTFASLLNHSVFITDSMEILSKITNNEVYKEIIANTLNTLSKGGKISESFRGQWAFPVVAYEMLVTGENTGQLGTMMEKVADHYSNLHRNSVTAIKTLIEPITICILAFFVGFILLSIAIPMFDMYSNVANM